MRKLDYKAKCKVCGKPATYRSNGLSQNIRTCTEHVQLIKDSELAYKADEHLSEADHMTWGKL
jgi:hypothetical protein